jgi:hypothetical protein
MRHARYLRRVCGVIAAASAAGSAGCTHHHYYGNVPVCGPVTAVPGTVANGSVCEVPASLGSGTLLGSGQGRSTIVGSAPYYSGARAPRVVTSEPIGGPRWRRADPDSGLAQTRVEGALDDDTTSR